MADSKPDPLDEIAEAIADGRPVDWEHWRGSRALSDTEIRALRRLEEIRRSQAGATGEAGGSAAAASPPLETGFVILEEIGRGSFGRVYRAVDRALGREVALKVLYEDALLAPDARARFIQEARVLASLDHPNIVRIHSVDEKDGRVRISLERIVGRTLDRLVKENGPFGSEEAARIGLDCCRALAALHAKGLVHQDLKPSNVMRAEGGRIVLLDFGVTRSASPRGEGGSGSISGTPRFRAPEQFEGHPDVDGRADLFSLGLLLYWLVSGRFPFEAKTSEELREKVLGGHAVPLADRRAEIPPPYAAIVERAIARRPEDRFESAGRFEAALRAFLAGTGAAVAALEDHPRDATGAVTRRRWLRVSGVAALVALGATLFALAVGGSLFSPSFEFEAQLFARREGKEVRLWPGDGVRLGDHVFLEVKASRDLHVYVFEEDDRGDLHALFPIPGFTLRNPLHGGELHRLPGRFGERREERDWVKDTPSGAENFVIVASAAPVEEAEKWLRDIAPAVPASAPDYPKVSGETRSLLLRGFGIHAPEAHPAPGADGRTSAGRLDVLIAALKDGPERVRGRVTRIVRLRGEG